MKLKADPYSRDARRPYQIPLKGWWQVAQRVWSESSRDNPSVVAAGCAFYALFAIFPAISALISLYALTADPIHVEQHFNLLSSLLPAQAFDMLTEQIRRIAETSDRTLGWGLVLSLGVALSLGVGAHSSRYECKFGSEEMTLFDQSCTEEHAKGLLEYLRLTGGVRGTGAARQRSSYA
jgi:membrane protein